MAETTLQLGFVPKERGNYTSGTNYYKDNIVQYNGSSYIADPVGWSESDPTATYVTIAPTDASGNLNAGWRVFASGNNTFTTGEKVDNVGIDSEPTAGSENLVKSGGTEKQIKNSVRTFIAKNVIDHTDEYFVEKKIIKRNGTYYPEDYNDYVTTGFIPCLSGDYFRPCTQVSTFSLYACFYDSSKNAIPSAYFHNDTATLLEVPNNKDIAFVRISHNSPHNRCWYNSREFFNIYVDYGNYALRIDKIEGYEERVSSIENTITTYHRLEEVCGRFYENLFNPNNSDVVDSAYIDSHGDIQIEGTTFVTGFIPCKGGDVFNWQGQTSTNSILCAVYDTSKQFIRQYSGGKLNPYNTIPDGLGIAYIRFCPPNSYKNRALYKYNGTINTFVEYGDYVGLLDNIEFADTTNLKTVLNSITNRVSVLESKANASVPTICNVLDRTDPDYANNSLLYSGVVQSGYSGYEVSGYIAAKAGDTFRLNKVTDDTNYKTWWAYYDLNKQKLGHYNEGNNGSHPYLLVPNNDNIAYIRVTIRWDITLYSYSRANAALYNTDKFVDIVKPYNEKIIYDQTIGYSSFGNKTLEEKVSDIENNITAIEETVGFWKYACDKILCFGDSLTDGLYAVRPAHGLIQQNYPYYLGRMLNTDVTNKGKNGSYPSECLSVIYPTVTITDYNTIIIWLGTNGGLKIADSASGLSNVSPEAQYLKYKELIETIQTSNTDCKIFIGKVFRTGEINSSATPGTVSETNAAIEQLATDYGIQIIDFSDLTPGSHQELHVNTSDTHFGKAGNIFIANRICKTFEAYFSADPLRCEFGLNTKESIWT